MSRGKLSGPAVKPILCNILIRAGVAVNGYEYLCEYPRLRKAVRQRTVCRHKQLAVLSVTCIRYVTTAGVVLRLVLTSCPVR